MKKKLKYQKIQREIIIDKMNKIQDKRIGKEILKQANARV
jgi:hypothetical protein